MRLFYLVLLCSVLSMPIYSDCFFAVQAAKNNDKKQKCSIQSSLGDIKNNLGKVLLCALATVYKYPSETCCLLYYSGKNQTQSIFEHFLIGIIEGIILGDFTRNIFHAYNVKHYPCEKEINNSTNPGETSDTGTPSDNTE